MSPKLYFLLLLVCVLPLRIPGEVIQGEEIAIRSRTDPGEKIEPRPQREVTHRGPIFFSDFKVQTNEIVRELVVIGGSVEVLGEVEGGVVVIGGKAKISGKVGRELVVVMGSAELDPGAVIGREAVLIGGPFDIAEGARVGREDVVIELGDVLPKIEGFKTWVFRALIWGRLLTTAVAWPWYIAGVFALLYLVLLLVFPAGVKATLVAMEERPLASASAGLLGLILFAPLIALLAVTVVGLLAIPFLKLGILVAIFLGKAALFCYLGRSIARAAHLNFLSIPFWAFLTGALMVTLLYLVPVIGILTWALGTAFAFGAALVALGSSLTREQNTTPPAPVLGSTLLHPAPPTQTAPAGETVSSSTHHTSAPASTLPPLTAGTAGINLDPGATLLLPRAGFWQRSVAAFLDLILLSLLLPLIGPFFVPVAILYFVAMWTWKGTTIGSIVLGLKIVRIDGRPVNFAVALVRSLSTLFSALVLFLGFLWVAWDPEKQAWHDKIAGTVVVKVPRDLALI